MERRYSGGTYFILKEYEGNEWGYTECGKGWQILGVRIKARGSQECRYISQQKSLNSCANSGSESDWNL